MVPMNSLSGSNRPSSFCSEAMPAVNDGLVSSATASTMKEKGFKKRSAETTESKIVSTAPEST